MFGKTGNEFLFISKCSEGQKMNFYTFRSVRRGRKWIFRGSEVFGRTGNRFLVLPSRSERLKMDFYTFRVARKHRKWIFIHSERLGSLENEFLYISSRSERAKMDFQRLRVARKGFFFQSTNSFGFIYIYPPNIYGKLLFRQSQQVDLFAICSASCNKEESIRYS